MDDKGDGASQRKGRQDIPDGFYYIDHDIEFPQRDDKKCGKYDEFADFFHG